MPVPHVVVGKYRGSKLLEEMETSIRLGFDTHARAIPDDCLTGDGLYAVILLVSGLVLFCRRTINASISCKPVVWNGSKFLIFRIPLGLDCSRVTVNRDIDLPFHAQDNDPSALDGFG